VAELDDRATLDVGGQADRDGADRSGQTSELTQQRRTCSECGTGLFYESRRWWHRTPRYPCSRFPNPATGYAETDGNGT
jgi:ribosomal protein S27AE